MLTFRSVPFSFRFYRTIRPLYGPFYEKRNELLVQRIRSLERNNPRSYGYIKSCWNISSCRTSLSSRSLTRRTQWQRLLHYYHLRHRAATIRKLLQEEGLSASCMGIQKFLQKYKETNRIQRRPGSRRPTKITTAVRRLWSGKWGTTTQRPLLSCMLSCCALATPWHWKQYLDFGLDIPRQCLLPVDMSGNKAKHLEWAQHHQNDNFVDVIRTDECLVQMESHRQFCCRKCSEAPKAKPRYVMDTASQNHFIQ